MKFYLMSIALILFSCSKSSQIPDSQFSESSCEVVEFAINFNSEVYSLNGSEFVDYDSKITGWIPDETDPTFYIITYDWRFCNFLELDIEQFSFTVEEINNPDGFWYEVSRAFFSFKYV